MKKLFIVLVAIFGVVLHSDAVKAAAPFVIVGLPERDPAPKERRWLRLSAAYQEDAALVQDILDALQIALPEISHVIAMRYRNQRESGGAFALLADDVAAKLRPAGLLGVGGGLRDSWIDIINEQYNALPKIHKVDPIKALDVSALADYPIADCASVWRDDKRNPVLTNQLESLYRIIKALKIFHPKALREYLCKSRSSAYVFSPDVLPILRRLNLLDVREDVKEEFVGAVLKIVTENREELTNLFITVAVEDLIARYGGRSDLAINLHLIGRNAVTPAMVAALNQQYPDLLILYGKNMTPEARVMIHDTYGNLIDAGAGSRCTAIPIITKEAFFDRFDREILDDWVVGAV